MTGDWIEAARLAAAGSYAAAHLTRHVESVVAYCEELAAHYPQADREVVMVAAWFHDLARVDGAAEGHHARSAELAREFLAARSYPPDRANLVAWTIFHHSSPVHGPERDRLPLEARILFDADKIDRVRGYYLAELLVGVGVQVAEEGGAWPAHLPSVRERYVGAYESLYTERARELAQAGFEASLDFLARVIAGLGIEGERR